jgi:hypothetical protein
MSDILYEKILSSDIRELPWKNVSNYDHHVANVLWRHILKKNKKTDGKVSVQDIMDLFDENVLRERGYFAIENFSQRSYEITQDVFRSIGLKLPELEMMPNKYAFVLKK